MNRRGASGGHSGRSRYSTAKRRMLRAAALGSPDRGSALTALIERRWRRSLPFACFWLMVCANATVAGGLQAPEPATTAFTPNQWPRWLSARDDHRPLLVAEESTLSLVAILAVHKRHPPVTADAMLRKWAIGPASLPCNELALDLIVRYQQNPLRAARMLALLHAAANDVIVDLAATTSEEHAQAVDVHVASAAVLACFYPASRPGGSKPSALARRWRLPPARRSRRPAAPLLSAPADVPRPQQSGGRSTMVPMPPGTPTSDRRPRRRSGALRRRSISTTPANRWQGAGGRGRLPTGASSLRLRLFVSVAGTTCKKHAQCCGWRGR